MTELVCEAVVPDRVKRHMNMDSYYRLLTDNLRNAGVTSEVEFEEVCHPSYQSCWEGAWPEEWTDRAHWHIYAFGEAP